MNYKRENGASGRLNVIIYSEHRRQTRRFVPVKSGRSLSSTVVIDNENFCVPISAVEESRLIERLVEFAFVFSENVLI